MSQPKPHDEHVQQADRAAVIHPLPGQADYQARDGPGQEEQRSKKRSAAELLVEQQRHRHAEHELADVGGEREECRHSHRLPELAAEVASGEQLLVVLEPDPDAGTTDQLGLEAE